MIISIIALLILLRLSSAQAGLSVIPVTPTTTTISVIPVTRTITDLSLIPVAPTTSALAAHQTFHVKVGDGQPRFQPNQLSVNVGDLVSFQIEGLSCDLLSSQYPCGIPEAALVEDEKQFVVRDSEPRIFFCGPAKIDGCSPDLLFILNAPHLSSQTFGLHGAAKAGSSSHIMSLSHIASSPVMSSAHHQSSSSPYTSQSFGRYGAAKTSSSFRIMSSSRVASSPVMSSAYRRSSTSPYTSHSEPLLKSHEAPTPIVTASGRASGTTSVYTPTVFPSSHETNFRSAAGAMQIIGLNLACVWLVVFYAFNTLH
ncbi:uncharacterized protein ATNIH1004_009267 [Aspergillus tanneri]|uniref:Ubiquitin 3 binding protein But2 C-terminal domain-containing protein n=1 Tax=Aspergillus tanneri TaxID=1220188 RepID=A0A5M9MH03_9EURO|nr:uncharacterized protein ATNIH1004_009267 [Aspergillus tanneri]KAA8645056.1 hypothetical protein ATNIH1004_009267 [Aspergillus tanneri]